MPHAGSIIDALFSRCKECAQVNGFGFIARIADDDQPGLVLHGNKGLRPQRVAFHHFDIDRLRAGLPSKDVDDGLAVIRLDINAGEIVKSFGRPLIDFNAFGAGDLDDVAKRRKAFGG